MKIAPLKGKAAFASTMRSGKRFTKQAITGIVSFRKPLEAPDSDAGESLTQIISLGVSIRKKTAKKATVRNRAKRLMRQSVRIVIDEFAAAGYFETGNPFNRVIVFSNFAPPAASQMSLEDILNDVRAVLQAAFDYSQKYSLSQ